MRFSAQRDSFLSVRFDGKEDNGVSKKVVIRAVTLVMLWPALFADFSPRACGADSTFNWKASKAEPYRPKYSIQSDTTNQPANEIRAEEFLKEIFETQDPKLS